MPAAKTSSKNTAGKNSSGNKDNEIHYCGECVHVTPVTRFNTLTLHGKMPTLGTCPYWKKSRCVLLSQRACKEHFKMRNQQPATEEINKTQ